MRILILLASLIAIIPGFALADYFKFLDSSTHYFIPNARVTLDNKIIGYTDGYGRLKVDLPKGDYQVRIEFRGGFKTAQLHVDGAKNLKTAEAH
jgi:hypothetical protein